MSSSSATGSGSRSPSPATPATPVSSDCLETPSIQTDIDLPAWYTSLSPDQSVIDSKTYWEQGVQRLVEIVKPEDECMLSLEDLIQDSAYDDSSSSSHMASSPVPAHAPVVFRVHPLSAAVPIPPQSDLPATITPTGSAAIIKSVVTLASQSRKRTASPPINVVYPPKESCSNLQVIIPSIPEGGTKSRVETQVRVTVDLAHASSSSTQPSQYDRVGSWKWLKLPQGTATKRRTRKEGKIDPQPEDILLLRVEVTCASPPHAPVLCCSSCQNREAKRAARKVAQRVRPQRPDSPDLGAAAEGQSEATSSIVQFNCAEVLDFSTGSVVLPLRITCYCRHHRERVGFHVHFTMSDNSGRVVGSGTTRPIMITDDHKSTGGSKQALVSADNSGHAHDWSSHGQDNAMAKSISTKRKFSEPLETSKKRARGPPSSHDSSAAVSRKSSSGSLGSSTSALPTRPTTPPHFFGSGASHSFDITAPSPSGLDNFVIQNAESYLSSPSVSAAIASPVSTDNMVMDSFEMSFNQMPRRDDSTTVQGVTSPTFLPTTPPSPSNIPILQNQALPTPALIPPIPFMFFHSDPPPPLSLPKPAIHRLIPSSGPTHGGIEVTVLGSNFHPSVQLDCVFGDVVASSTQRWSDNTLVCILPPRVCSGVVAVWFDGIQKDDDGTPPCLFTYTDESDRALMELALQVVGLKMTGKLEDAKSVAMRIVGPSNNEPQPGSQSQNMTQLASNSLALDNASLLRRVRPRGELEKMVLDTLALLDISEGMSSKITLSQAMSHQTTSGQTLLHLACFLKYPALAAFLARHETDLDARDRNGFTALHLAGAVGAQDCARVLLNAGADTEIVNASGKTAQEIASFDFASLDPEDNDDASSTSEADEESRWGDAEEESDEEIVIRPRRGGRTPKRGLETSVVHSSEDEKARAPTEPRPIDTARVRADEKQAASFIDAIQRTLARVQPVQGIIPNMPHLPNMPQFLPNLPQLPGMPGLPQIPMVFPVYVPWPAFFTEKRGEHTDQSSGGHGRNQSMVRAFWTPQEWRAFWEKWSMYGGQANPAEHDEPPPMYTPRAEAESVATAPAVDETQEEAVPVAGPSVPCEHSASRRATFDVPPVPAREVDAYGYQPNNQQARQLKKKEDRMLLLFWIPILLLALLWALFHGARIAVHNARTMTPLKAILRL
ncbi:hypothetical protein OF83DRAFT_1132025 [Amylostereum chailletii]|nr:hypothetical protein OF83DRAFT_1132025 [Amylostereum chailletii]